jgi:hypothetical protein
MQEIVDQFVMSSNEIFSFVCLSTQVVARRVKARSNVVELGQYIHSFLDPNSAM